jgi:glycosyltransferase involved in cell wall biosynthesis
LARNSTGVIATNHEDAARLNYHRHHALIPIGSSVQVDLPPDYDRSTWRARLGIPDDAFVVAHFGFINHSKGVDTLIDALALLKSTPRPIHLLMIGGRTGSSDPTNAAYAQTIDARIEAAGLAAQVHWTGFVDDRAASGHFAASDVVALPFRDGASYRRSSVMAAIQHGCAIVTTRPTVHIPAFVSGQNMLIVAPGNAPALAAALQIAGKSPALIDQLRAGALTLRQQFAWDHIARDNAEFFQKVVDDSQTR